MERGRLAETFFEGAGRAGPFSAGARGRFLAFDGRLDPVQAPAPPPPASRFLDRFTELGAHATFSSRRGDAVRVGLLAVGSGASGALVAGIDPLFDLAPAPLRAAAQASAGARMVLGPGTFTYDVLFPARPGTFQCSPSEPPRPVGALHVQQHAGSFTWDSPCRCFRVVAAVGLNQCDVWSYSFALDLAQLGSRAFPR